MRHTFLLDENILEHAIRGVDEYNRHDLTTMEFVVAIVKICHKIAVDRRLLDKYHHRLSVLFRVRPPALPPLFFINQLLKNSTKLNYDYRELPTIPDGVQVPDEDVEIVRAALLTGAILVTADHELRDAVNRQPLLGVRALSPQEALDFAQREHP